MKKPTLRDEQLIRISFFALYFLVITYALGAWASWRLPIASADAHEWLPSNRPERQRYELFLERFGNDQIVLLSWPGCTISDSRLPEYVRRLESHADFAELFLEIKSTDRVVQKLTSPPLRLTERESQRRLQGVFMGKNGTAMVLARVSSQGVAKQRETIQLLRTVADQVEGLGADQLRMVGSVFESNAIDAAAETSFKTLVIPSACLGLLITSYCLGSVRSSLLVLVLAGAGQLLAVSLVYYTGQKFSAVMIVFPTLVFMLTLSGAIHLANYYWEVPDKAHHEPRGLETLKLGWQPCALSSFTTMLGMGSLILSQLSPVRQFGLFSAVGLGLATVLLLAAFPVLADKMYEPWRAGQGPGSEVPRLGFPRHFLSSYLSFQRRYANWITGLSFLLLVVTLPAATRLNASTKFCDMFHPGSRIATDMDWFERNIGPIAGAEVLLHFDASTNLSLLEQAGLVRQVARHLSGDRDVGGVMSAISFLPTWQDIQSARALATRTLLQDRLEQDIGIFQEQGLIYQDDNQTIWRIACKVSATSKRSYGEVATRIEAQVVESLSQEPSANLVRVEVTGLSPVLHETQVVLLRDLLNSFLTAFVLITPVMIWMARSFWGGLLIMLPNVLPVTLVLGLFGWRGWDIDVAGILTASIALGIAVDDTLHFVNWYQRELREGCPKPVAIRHTFETCATAMCHTTIVSCVTMLPFLFSDFVPTQRFAGMMIGMLTAALAGDLIVLPALLLSPLGHSLRGGISANAKPPSN